MTTKQVAIAFLVLYLILMGVGGAMYYAIVNAPKERAEIEAKREEQKKTEVKPEAKTVKTADKNQLDKATREKAQKEAEALAAKQQAENEKKAQELAEQQKKADREKLIKLKADIEGKMKVITRGGVTYYTHNRGKELSGVHLRPFIAENNGTVILKHDIYYYSALDDPNYGWIHGSNLDVTADGQTFSFALDPSKRRDKLGKGAEDLTESYVMDADKNIEAMLKAVGNATNVTIHYYGQSDITSALSREDIRRINEMMTYYEILEKEANGDL